MVPDRLAIANNIANSQPDGKRRPLGGLGRVRTVGQSYRLTLAMT